MRDNAGRVVQVRTVADLDSVERGERIGLMLSLEGVEQFGYETWPAETFWELGVRMAGLTWNRRNPFADGAAEQGGLSRLGRELVDRLVELGIVLDLAHASRGTFAEILDRVGDAPLLCSHAGCRALNEHPRNLDDEQMRELAARGGLLGLMLHPLAIGHESRTIDRVIDHLEHAVEVMGADRVCLGGDFTTRLTQVLSPFPQPADGLMPQAWIPAPGSKGCRALRTIRHCLPPSPGAAGRRRRSRRSRVETCSLCCVEPSLHRALCPRANRRPRMV